MSKIASLKKKAFDLEKKSLDKAIAVYIELLSAMEDQPAEMDVALFNRVGDLLVKQGNVADAVDYYEKAVDHYVDGGFLNNAIALCNKILRTSPGRASVYYKLGKVSAHKGFKADAKQNFLEYADRMQKAGKMDEAFRALAEFADLCPDQTDIRLMLSEQLLKAGKKAEAIEQLQILHEQLDAEGAADEAAAAAERLRAIDPSVEPRRGGSGRSHDTGGGGGGDLVFIDLGDSPSAQSQRRSMARATSGGMKAVPDVEPPKPAAASAPPPPPPAPPPAPEPPAASAPPVAEPGMIELESTGADSLIEPTNLGETPQADAGALPGLESTSLSDPGEHGMVDIRGGLDIETTSMADAGMPAASDANAGADASAGSLDFIMPDAAPGDSQQAAESAASDLPLIEGEIELSVGDAADTSPVIESPTDSSDADAGLELVDLGGDAGMPTPASVPRTSTLLAARSVEVLQAVVDGDPDDWGAHRELAEAMLESGDREAGVRELEIAMLGFERAGDLGAAMSVAEEIVRVDPSSVKYHQKRVEYAYRSNDKPLLVEAYLALADALFRNGQVDKSRSIYQRVLELSPGDVRAEAALSTMPEPEPPPAADGRPSGRAEPAVRTSQPVGKPTPVANDSFVNLGDWLREDAEPKDTRMVVAEQEPSGNEEADFQDMLRKFKQGVAENVEAEDYQSHYDLGVAFKEMGLVDEAIAEFQKALRGPANRVRTYEAIGQCFIEKEQYQMARTILGRALNEGNQGDDELIGVLYLLGRANEGMGRSEEALQYYQRVFVVDIQFHDVGERMNALEAAR